MQSTEVIKLFNLQLNDVEGGYFAPAYPLPPTENTLCSAIYYFLDDTRCSIMHKVTGDMLYHFYAGEPIEMLLLYPKNHIPSSEVYTFSNDLAKGGKPMKVIPGGTWLGSKIKSKKSWALMGVSMAPPFNPNEYFLGDRNTLIKEYPEHEKLIMELTNP